MPLYTAYGLGINSALDLPELVPGANKIDLTINWGRDLKKPSEANHSQFYYWRNEREIGLHWQELGTFLIREGKEIFVEPIDPIEEQYLHPALLGACMAVLLHQRGYLILHSSAVKIQDRAIAFIGDKGWGKSTMAAALISKGHQFVTDDVLAIAFKGNKPIVFPSFPQLKLCPDAVEAMGQNPARLPRIMPQITKRQYKPNQNFSSKPVPLDSIYLLSKGESLSIKSIATGDSFLPLLAHSYGARFGKKLLYLGEANHFQQCMELARKAKIYRLERPANLSLLDRIVDLLEQHCL